MQLRSCHQAVTRVPLAPFPRSVVAIEAGYSIGPICRPIHDAEAGVGQPARDLMILDDDQPPRHAHAFGKERVRIHLVMEHVGENHHVPVSVVDGKARSCIGLDWYHGAGSRRALEARDADTCGTHLRFQQGAPKRAAAAPDVENGVAFTQVRCDEPDQLADAMSVHRLVERSEQRVQVHADGIYRDRPSCGNNIRHLSFVG